MIECKYLKCKRKFKTIQSLINHVKIHGFSSQEYYNKFFHSWYFFMVLLIIIFFAVIMYMILEVTVIKANINNNIFQMPEQISKIHKYN